MMTTIDPQILWQQWTSQQTLWSQWIAQQPTPLIQNSLERIQEVSKLYQELAKALLPYTSDETPTAEALHQWLEILHSKMSAWAKQQHSVAPDNTAQVLQSQIQQWQQVQQAILHYQSLSTKYQTQLDELNQQVLSTLKARFLDSTTAPNIDSLQSLMNEWGKTYEQHYQTWTSSESYQTLLGELTNAGASLKTALQTHFHPIAQWLELPTQADWQLMAERFQELRRDNQALRKQVADLAVQVKVLSQQSGQNVK
jgi:hypothetical protein